MFGSWFRKVREGRNKPLAQCPDRSPGTVRPEGSTATIPVVVLEANGTGVVVQADCPSAQNNLVIGQYAVAGVQFAYRGVVNQTHANRDGTWTWHIRFVMAGY